MEPTDLFRLFLVDYLKDKKRGFQKDLAKKAGVDEGQLSEYLHKTKVLGEKSRVKISQALNIHYEDCIARGRKLAGEKNGEVVPFIEKRRIFEKYNFLQDLCAELQKENPNSELAAINSAIAFLYEKKGKLKKRKRVRREEQR